MNAQARTNVEVSEKASRFEVLFFTLLFCALVVPNGSNAISWLYAQGMFPLRPLLYIVAVSGAAIVIGIMKRPAICLPTVLIPVLLILFILDMLILRRYDPPFGLAVAVGTYGSGLVMVTGMILLVACFFRKTKTPILWCAFLILVLSSGSIYLEHFGMIKTSSVPGRAAGFAVDANRGGCTVIFSLVTFLTFSKRLKLNFALIGISFLSIMFTLSRSGMISMMLLILIYLTLMMIKRPKEVVMILVVAIPVLMLVGPALMNKKGENSKNKEDVNKRMTAIFGGNLGRLLNSSDRSYDLHAGMRAVPERPFFGYGTGASQGRWKPHNQIVSLAIDGGMLYLMVYGIPLIALAFGVLKYKGKAILCSYASVFFLPFSQTLTGEMAYWFMIVAALYLVVDRKYRFRIRGETESGSAVTTSGHRMVAPS